MKIGIDIGGSHIAIGIVKENGNVLGKKSIDNKASQLKNEEEVHKFIIENIEKAIEDLLKENGYEKEDITKIGIGVPGNPTKEAIQNAVNLKIKNFEIGKILKEKYNSKVLLKNDGKCAGLAEKKYGALKKYDNCIFLCIGTGVGSAVFIDGELLELKNTPGFEFGHMIIEKNGKKCNCGNCGCFETYASMKRFKTEAIKKFELQDSITSEELQKYIRTNINSEKIKSFIEEYIENLSIGILNIVNIFEPEAICFGGSFSYYTDIFLPKLEEKIKTRKFNKNTKSELVSAKLLNDAGIIGSAELK